MDCTIPIIINPTSHLKAQRIKGWLLFGVGLAAIVSTGLIATIYGWWFVMCICLTLLVPLSDLLAIADRDRLAQPGEIHQVMSYCHHQQQALLEIEAQLECQGGNLLMSQLTAWTERIFAFEVSRLEAENSRKLSI